MKPLSSLSLLLLAACAAACGSSQPAGTGAASSSSGTGGASTSTSAGSSSGTGGATASSSSGAGTTTSSTTASGDPLRTSFVYVGCNRLDNNDWDPVANPSSANTVELQQTFADVTALPALPRLFFFTGDLVLGLSSGKTQLQGQLDGWAQLFSADPSGIAAKVPLVPLVGNHESLYKTKVSGTKVEISNGAADGVWVSWIAAHGFDAHAGNGPTNAPPNADALQDDESRLTYSFDVDGTHYVVLDTDSWTTTPDPATGSTQIGWIALQWLKADLAAAQANAAVRDVFVLGHKPVVSPLGSTASDATINPSLTAALEALLDQSTKVRGYLCAHAHMWDARRLPGPRGVYQVTAGNGGSPVESAWSQPSYGFTEVRVYESGKVGVVSYQRPVPSPYNGSPASPATAQPEIVIAP